MSYMEDNQLGYTIYAMYGGQSPGIYNICHVWGTITWDIIFYVLYFIYLFNW